jgi:UDP-glucose 4-epimerase
MKILLAGGAGDVGKALARRFLAQGHAVRILDRVVLSPTEQLPGLTFLQGTLADEKAVREAMDGIEAVVQLAWSFSDDPRVVIEEDLAGHARLLEAAAAAKVKSFIYTSTATVYGRAVLHPVDENHPCLLREARKPLYALGKWAAEELCLLYHRERGLPATILRFWWAFGETIAGRHLRDLVKKALKREPLEMVRGAGGAFISMGDLASAVEAVIAHPSASGQAYNVGSFFLTWEEVGRMIIEQTGSDSTLSLLPSDGWRGPAFLNEVWDLSWDKAVAEIGYRPKGDPEGRALFARALQTCVDRVKEGSG